MYNLIMVPIDLSHADKGKAMINVARTLKNRDGRIMLTSVIQDVPAYVAAELPSGLLEKGQQEAATQLKAIANAAGLDAETVIETGHPSTCILSLAEAKGADLIIIASHRPGIQDYFLGSTASRVVRHAKCSVLVVR